MLRWKHVMVEKHSLLLYIDMASSYPTNSRDSESAIEVIPRDEHNPHLTSLANDDYDDMPKAGGHASDNGTETYRRSNPMTARHILESEDDHNQGSDQHTTDLRTPLVQEVKWQKGWKKGWSRINDMGRYYRTVICCGLLYSLTEYADPITQAEKRTPLQRLLASAHYPLEQRIQDKKNGVGRQKHPFVGMSPASFIFVCY